MLLFFTSSPPPIPNSKRAYENPTGRFAIVRSVLVFGSVLGPVIYGISQVARVQTQGDIGKFDRRRGLFGKSALRGVLRGVRRALRRLLLFDAFQSNLGAKFSNIHV